MLKNITTPKQRDAPSASCSGDRGSESGPGGNDTKHACCTKVEKITLTYREPCSCGSDECGVKRRMENLETAQKQGKGKFITEIKKNLDKLTETQLPVAKRVYSTISAPMCHEIEKVFFDELGGRASKEQASCSSDPDSPPSSPQKPMSVLKMACHQLPQMCVQPTREPKPIWQLKQMKSRRRPRQTALSSIDSGYGSDRGSIPSLAGSDSDSESSVFDKGLIRRQKELSRLLDETSVCSPECKCRLLSPLNGPEPKWPYTDAQNYSFLTKAVPRESRCRRKLNLVQFQERKAFKSSVTGILSDSLAGWTLKGRLQFIPGFYTELTPSKLNAAGNQRKPRSAPNSPKRPSIESSRRRHKTLERDLSPEEKTSYYCPFPGSQNSAPTPELRRYGLTNEFMTPKESPQTVPEVDPAILRENPDFYHRKTVFWPSPPPRSSVAARKRSPEPDSSEAKDESSNQECPEPPPPHLSPTSNCRPKFYNPKDPYWAPKPREINSETAAPTAVDAVRIMTQKLLETEAMLKREAESNGNLSTTMETTEKSSLELEHQTESAEDSELEMESCSSEDPDCKAEEEMEWDPQMEWPVKLETAEGGLKIENENTDQLLPKKDLVDPDDSAECLLEVWAGVTEESDVELNIDVGEEIKPEEIKMSATEVFSDVLESSVSVHSDTTATDDSTSDSTSSPGSFETNGWATWPQDETVAPSSGSIAPTKSVHSSETGSDLKTPTPTGNTKKAVAPEGDVHIDINAEPCDSLSSQIRIIQEKTDLHLALESARTKFGNFQKKMRFTDLVDERKVHMSDVKAGSDPAGPQKAAALDGDDDDVQVIKVQKATNARKLIHLKRLQTLFPKTKMPKLPRAVVKPSVLRDHSNTTGARTSTVGSQTHRERVAVVPPRPIRNTHAAWPTPTSNWGSAPPAAPRFPGSWEPMSGPQTGNPTLVGTWYQLPNVSYVVPPHAPVMSPSGQYDFMTGSFYPAGHSVVPPFLHSAGPPVSPPPPPLPAIRYSFPPPGVTNQPPVQYVQYVPRMNVPSSAPQRAGHYYAPM